MKKAFLLLSLAGSLLSANAQMPQWGITFTPSLIYTNRLNYGLQLGAERTINPRLSLLTELTILPGSGEDSVSLNTKFFRIKPELRYVFSRNESTVRLYGGLQVSYSFRQWENLAGGCYFRDVMNEDTTIRYDRARITSPVFTSSLQLGTLVDLGPHFTVDFFMGMGARFIDTKYSDVHNETKDVYYRPVCTIMFRPSQAWWVDGKITRFHSNLGVRVIYRF